MPGSTPADLALIASTASGLRGRGARTATRLVALTRLCQPLRDVEEHGDVPGRRRVRAPGGHAGARAAGLGMRVAARRLSRAQGAARYATTYGAEEPIAELIPAMLAAFLDSEFGKFEKASKA